MKLDSARVRELCARRKMPLTGVLHQAGVSRTAYYSLLRKDSVLPESILALADTLDVSPSELLTETPTATARARALLRKARRIVRANPGLEFEHVWHTLALLEEEPGERLWRSLRRGRALDLH